jgi:hypothetical protein
MACAASGLDDDFDASEPDERSLDELTADNHLKAIQGRR